LGGFQGLAAKPSQPVSLWPDSRALSWKKLFTAKDARGINGKVNPDAITRLMVEELVGFRLRRSPQPGGQFFIHEPAMANGHQADDARLSVYAIDDPKAADAVFPQPVEFAHERLPTLGGDGNRANGSFDRTFQIRVERPDHRGHMRRNVRPEQIHAPRRFLAGVTGSPNTSSKASPFPPDR
jgi:hypothetical protein